MRSSAKETRKPSAVRSARKTVPATFHCTFSKLAQKTAARKKKETSLRARASLRLPCRLQSTRPAPRRGSPARAASAAPARGSRRRACPPASARGGRAAPRAARARRRARRRPPTPVSRTSSAAAPSGGTAARIGRSAARYSKIFPDGTTRPRPAASGSRSRFASESRCSSSASAVRNVGEQLEPVAEAERPPPTRGRRRGSRRRSARRRRRGPTRRARSGTGAGRAGRRSCRCA